MWLGHGNGPSKRRPTKQWRKRGKATKEPSHEIQRCGTWHTMKRLIPLCWIFSTKVGEFLFRCFFVGCLFIVLRCIVLPVLSIPVNTTVCIICEYFGTCTDAFFFFMFVLSFEYNDHHCSQYEPIVRSRFHRRSAIQSANVHRNIVVRFLMLRVGCCTPMITCGTEQDVNKHVQLEWFKLYPAFILLFGDVYFTNTNTFFPLFSQDFGFERSTIARFGSQNPHQIGLPDDEDLAQFAARP